MHKPEDYIFPRHKTRGSSLYESSSYVSTYDDAESAYTLHVEIGDNLYFHLTFYPERPAITVHNSHDDLADSFDRVFFLICLRVMNTGEMIWMNE